MPEMTETQTPGRKPKKKKNKESHNAVERHRKEKINAGINRIGNLLPCSQALKQSKNMILDQAFRYITELKKQNDTLLLEGGDKVQAEEIRRLRRQMEELRRESAHYIELLKANDINILEDPTVHWKGKQRCAKVAKVPPTHQLPKGIIVYSNGNVMCPAGKETSPTKQPSETLILQQPSEVSARLRVNGALLQVNTSSSTPALLPGSTATPIQSTPGLRMIEQCVVETPAAAPTLPPSVSYITLQIPAATTALPQQPQPATPAPTLTIAATSATQIHTESSVQSVPNLTTLTQAIATSRAAASEVCSWVTQDTAMRTVNYTAIPNSQALLRAGAAGSTQTTWTTLQMAGNTVQPVCQSLPTPEVISTTQAVQQVTVCPLGNKPSVQPIQIQMQPHVPVQQAPITAHIQAQHFQRPTQLRPAMLNQAQPQSVLASQPQCAVLSQSAIVPQPGIVAHTAVVPSQPQPAVLQPASLVPHAPTALIPQPQPIPQPALVPQPQATVLPLLQTMQVLQVNPTGGTASGVTAPQNTNNPSVVILQQASSCPTQSVVREELTNPTPCQHIVIIQAPNQVAPAPQNPQVGMVPAAVPTAVPVVSTQIPTTSSSTSGTSLQSVGGKQLVHILPRPVQPQVNNPLQVTQASSSPPVPPTPQTITVNGQVFALQPMKTSDKSSSQAGQSTLQLVQPTTTEEPTTNVALNSLGALSSLNQSISQGLPLTISSQNNGQPPVVPSSVVSAVQQKQSPAPVSVPGTALALPVRQLQVPCLNPVKSGLVVSASKPPGKRLRTTLNAKRATAKRTKSARKKELSQAPPAVAVAAKPVVTTGESQTVQVSVSQVLQSASTIKATGIPTTCTTVVTTTDPSKAVGNAPSTHNTQLTIVCSSSSDATVFSQPHPQSKISVSATQTEVPFSHTNTSGMATAVTTADATLAKPTVSAAVAIESKPAGNNSTVTKLPVPEVKKPTTSSETSTTQSKSAATTVVSKPSKSVVSSAGAAETSTTVSTACLTPVRTSVPTTPPVSSHQATQPTPVSRHQSNNQDPLPCNKPQSQPTTSLSVSTTVALPSPAAVFSAAHSSVTAPTTSSEFKKRVTTSRAPTQPTDMNMPNTSPCHPAEIKPPQPPRRDREVPIERHSTAAVKDSLVEATSGTTSRKDFALSQQVYTNLDDQTIEHPMTSSRQTDSPMSSGAGAGRSFSVASMLPQGHTISGSSGSFGTFTFTSEQAEMLALAMLEQDSPGRRSGSCSGNTASTNPTAATWEPPKPPVVSSSKDRGSTGQQTKVTKPMDTVKPTVQASVRGQAAEGSNGSRLPQNISYSQSQSVPQVQSQSSSQSGTVASLSVNNLIRPSSSQQPYPGSPSLAGQQGSVPSPVGTPAHISQPPNNALSPCSGAAQLNEYTPLKTALMRAQAGVGVGERQVKIISKRQAQEEVMLNTGKRPKPCPPSATTVSHMDVKAPDHSQMMVGQLPPTSSAVMTRINADSGGPLFSTNSFMSPVVRPTDGHCPPQGPPEQNQPGVLHLPQGHPQHAVTQPGQHLGGNIYMKQQQQEQQRHHLYHLQHHLTQPDPAQRHSLHQRALQQQQEQQQQQQQQQQQHVQKKRGLVRGSQTGSPAGLQQKQHHLEKSGVQQQQHSHQQQQTQHQQHTQQQQSQQHQQQSHQQSQQHQQPTQHQQSHPQQQTHQQQPQTQHQQHQQQQQQLQQQQQSSHSRHQQHIQQQIQQQQQQQHFRHQEKSCEAQATGSRGHHSSHLAQQEHLKPGQDHNAMQRMMSTRTLEQQLIPSPSNPASRSSDLACAPSRQERHRVSSYSAEALIGKSSTSGEQQQRMGLHLQPGRGTTQDQPDLRGYLDTSRGKANIAHNPQNRLPSDHQGSADVQRVSECPPFKPMGGGAHQLGGFEAQVSRGSDMAPKSVPSSQRGPQGQQQGGFRMGVGPPPDGRNRYSAAHPGSQGVQVGLPREQEGCHQSFMQSLLSPHLPEQSNHQRAVQCCPPVSMEYSCVPGSSSGDIQAKASSPSVPQTQKAPSMRLGEGNKGHISQVSSNMHGGPGVRAGLPHPPTPHGSSEPGRSSAPSRPPAAVSQHSRHIARDTQATKLRPGDRPRSGTLRQSNPFEPDGHLPLPSGGGVLLGRPQSGGEARRSTIVRFMADSGQVPGDNNLVPDQHLTQNFGFPFIPEGGMNPPPINANSTFIPPVSQPNASRTPSLLPVEPQNTLPSFYPSYSPAAHPSLPSDVTLQYFPNQMFTSPSADKGSAPPLNNRFGSILSPPRPVGFGQASFPLLPDMPPMPIANSSGITPHISNFSLTSLFPEIATGMPTDGSAMPMSPLLSLSNTSAADSGKQPNRPAHNISHILGHDGSSAV
ncbi:basic helix-loop-helix domain-containing protein USF3 [Centropristis striata]|uniref:basic helix-loop-helix domain-containing protein USF3 n=1 Tax=Centropristis striata TaxID=184440 RepID=UPI0027E07F60|nr:basic helix-loop-helix domain-containing protein USF3 [Centropristis striata]XP_059183253.1 basic helix-loop-helix domain-containing protein USF3 [Centropristis striata]XP_059183254.1 basic helix-loop-helix domain-containing protein USF3 [Centropristis striata]